jgi:hypothetical protein
MKRVLFAISLIACVIVIAAGTDLMVNRTITKNKKNCFGYTIIEAGKGINCAGDTIPLKIRHGYYKLITQKKN